MNKMPSNNTLPSHAIGSSHKLAYTVAEACAATGLGRTSVYEQINAGHLKSIKAAGRRLILRSDLEAFLASFRHA